MSQKKNLEAKVVSRERVGTFHFAPFGSQLFRLVAVMYNGEYRQLQTAPTIGDLWHTPWLVKPEWESDVVELRVERQVDQNGKKRWKPMLHSVSRLRDSDD